MTGTILVGVDNTNTALAAAEKAASLAAALQVELHVVSAYDEGVPRIQTVSSHSQAEAAMEEYSESVAQRRDEAQGAADSVVEALLSKFPSLNVHGRAIEGAPGPAIIQESKALDADMVVVGNRNVQGFGRLLGSIATTVAREIDCDLHIVNTRNRG